METLPASELENRLAQLDKMLEDLISGRLRRTTFQPWEVEVLLEIQACRMSDSKRKMLLRRYQKAVHRWFSRGERTLLSFSDYLAKRRRGDPFDGGYAPTGGPVGRSSQ